MLLGASVVRVERGYAMDFRTLDATAANIIAYYPKVLEVLRGEIPVPVTVEFFLTNFCSFRCPHCRCAGSHGTGEDSIDLTLFEQILDELLAADIRTIEFGGGGEPLEHPEIIKILDLLASRNMRCGIITNGYAFVENEDLFARVPAVADWIRISLDAVTEESFKRVHGREDISYAKLREALRMFKRPIVLPTFSGNRTRT